MTNEVKNRNFSSEHQFSFQIEKMPTVNFFVQQVNLPSISIDAIVYDNPFTDAKVPGEQIIWNNLNVTFLVDEDYNNWYECWNWMQGIGFPQNFTQNKALVRGLDTNLDGEKRQPLPPKGRQGFTFSEASLFIRTGKNNPNIEVRYIDCWPTSLSELQFNTTTTEDNPLTATVTLAYNYYTIGLS
jgi:hypothetical protein